MTEFKAYGCVVGKWQEKADISLFNILNTKRKQNWRNWRMLALNSINHIPVDAPLTVIVLVGVILINSICTTVLHLTKWQHNRPLDEQLPILNFKLADYLHWETQKMEFTWCWNRRYSRETTSHGILPFWIGIRLVCRPVTTFLWLLVLSQSSDTRTVIRFHICLLKTEYFVVYWALVPQCSNDSMRDSPGSPMLCSHVTWSSD
jgi:hypothetical protein